jgi:hypothetical protein
MSRRQRYYLLLMCGVGVSGLTMLVLLSLYSHGLLL